MNQPTRCELPTASSQQLGGCGTHSKREHPAYHGTSTVSEPNWTSKQSIVIAHKSCSPYAGSRCPHRRDFGTCRPHKRAHAGRIVPGRSLSGSLCNRRYRLAWSGTYNVSSWKCLGFIRIVVPAVAADESEVRGKLAVLRSCRYSRCIYSASGAVIAVAPSVDLDSLTDLSGSSLTTQVFTTTFQTTLAFSSGTGTPGQIVDVTQTSTRIVPVPTASDSAPATSTAQVTPRSTLRCVLHISFAHPTILTSLQLRNVACGYSGPHPGLTFCGASMPAITRTPSPARARSLHGRLRSDFYAS